MLIAGIGVVVTGDLQAQADDRAAADEDGGGRGALRHRRTRARSRVFTIGSLDGTKEVWSIRVPGVLSFMATGSFDGTVEGINELQQLESRPTGPATTCRTSP